MKHLFIPIVLVAILIISCQQDTTQTVNSNAEQNSTEDIIDTTKEEKVIIEIVAADESYLNSIRAKATGIEATMYSSNASFSVSNKENTFTFLKQLSLQAPSNLSKEQVGHIMFLENGSSLMVCSVYKNNNEVYIQFKEDENTYYNILVGNAANLFTQVQVQPKQ